METEMLKDHDTIDSLIREHRRESSADIRKLPEVADTGKGKVTEMLFKVAFPLVSTALATVVRAVIERAIGG